MKTNDYVIAYMPFAENLAWKKSRALPKCVSLDELKSAAYLGLVVASRRFDSSSGISFPKFAFKHIVGAIGDYLRELHWRGTSLGEEPVCSQCEKIEEELEGLDSLQRTVVIMYYKEGFTQKEIGSKIGFHESRISQILKGSIQSLRSKKVA